MISIIKTQEQKDILNKEARVRASKKYYLKHKETVDKRTNAYNKTHSEKCNALQKKYYHALDEEGYKKISTYHAERYKKQLADGTRCNIPKEQQKKRGRPKKQTTESSGESGEDST